MGGTVLYGWKQFVVLILTNQNAFYCYREIVTSFPLQEHHAYVFTVEVFKLLRHQPFLLGNTFRMTGLNVLRLNQVVCEYIWNICGRKFS